MGIKKKEVVFFKKTQASFCNYLIIEPFESQEKWYWDWRYRFPEAKEIWEIGKTRVEKLCD